MVQGNGISWGATIYYDPNSTFINLSPAFEKSTIYIYIGAPTGACFIKFFPYH